MHASANREVFVGIPECPRNAQFGKSIQLATISRASLTLVFTDVVHTFESSLSVVSSVLILVRKVSLYSMRNGTVWWAKGEI